MPTTLALLRDPGAIAVIVFGYLAFVAYALRLWIVATRRAVAERRRPERAERVDLTSEAEAFKHRRAQEAAVA